MNITIIGVGYVGLVTGVCFAEMGHNVTCLDIDTQKIENLQNGILPIYEKGLQEMLVNNKKRLRFIADYDKALATTNACFICVPTPEQEDGSCDLQYVEMAAKSIAKSMTGDLIIINKSTSPVGTAAQIKSIIENELSTLCKNISFSVVSNPEFLKEGSAIEDCMKPDRIVIGVENTRARQVMKEIYASFNIKNNRMLFMDIASAELTKYASNAMLATRISFMNEMANLCEKVNANINDIRLGIGSDQRIGPDFLYAGMGFGGSCFPKDVSALIAFATQNKIEMPILSGALETNAKQKKIMGTKVKKYFESSFENRIKIAIWGLSFKPETDDIREAPSLVLIKDLLDDPKFELSLYDPIAMSHVKRQVQHEKVIYCSSEYEAAQGAHAIILVTDWKQFRFADMKKILQSMQGKVFFDGRNQYSACEMEKIGFTYFGIGLQNKKNPTQILQSLKEHSNARVKK